ncbi:MAG: hypothetical protein AAGC44_10370 [Planctomycetota bacterium]
MDRTLLSLLVTMLALPAVAQDEPAPKPPPPKAPEVEPEAPARIDLEGKPSDELAVLLGDIDFEVRQEAMARLVADDTLDELVLRELLVKAETVEQRERLLIIAEHHVIRELREQFEADLAFIGTAGVGFTYHAIEPGLNPHTERGASVVTHTMPGFPGFVHLRPGDVIVEINEIPCFSRDENSIQIWVQRSISRQNAGSRITMVVYRRGVEMKLDFSASSITALNHFYQPSSDWGRSRLARDYREHWEGVRERLLAGLPVQDSLVPEPVE